MTDQDRELQERARRLVDEELIPYEVDAEMNGGELPEAVTERHRQRVRELGLAAINMPRRLGGAGLTMFQQALVQEQIGRVTNGLGWVVDTPAAWLVDVATPHQIETWIEPAIRGERRECYAITEEGAGSDVDAIAATARRDGDQYVLSGEKWHVTSANLADHVFFQAKLTEGPNAGAHALFVVGMDTPGLRVVRTPAYSHTLAHHHPILAFEDVRVPVANLIGSEGDGMRFVQEWFRYERLMIAARCCGAAERLITEATAFAKEREAFGERISSFQAVQFMLADSLNELWAAR